MPYSRSARRLKPTHATTVRLRLGVPVRVAYVWFIAFSIIFIVPFVWYALNNALAMLSATVTASFPESFSSAERAGATNLFANFWAYMPVIVLIPVFIWAIMQSLKEKRWRERYY